MAKFLKSDDKEFVEFLQKCDLPNPRFYLKRDYLTEQDFHAMAEGTTWLVLSDPVGDVEPRRKFVFCKCKKCGFRRNVRFADLKSNNTICDNCLLEKLKAEAESAGCELIGFSEINKQYRKYSIKSCGHVQDIRTESIRKNCFRCRQCFIDSIYKACEGTTFEPIIEDGYSYKFKAVCKVCGAVGNKTVKLVGKCSNCIELKEKELAKNNGATWATRLSGPNRLYLLDCGHYITAKAPRISAGIFECKQCNSDRFIYHASLSETEIIDSNTNDKSRVLCKLKCGCVTEVRRDAIYRGRVYCKTHDYNFYSNPNGLYLIELQNGDFSWLKLGMSLDVERRISDYKLSDDTTYTVLKYIKIKSGYEAIKVENKLHKKYDEFNLDKNLMYKYMLSGFTECYPISIKENLLLELEELIE